MSTTISTPSTGASGLAETCRAMALRAQGTVHQLSSGDGAIRDAALREAATAIRTNAAAIVLANGRDLTAAAEAGLSTAMIDRLRIDGADVEKIAESVDQIAGQDDPFGQVIEGRVLSNGLRLQKVRVPIGVVLIIFESRPNVTSDAAALCIKSGNAVILRGGKEAKASNNAIADCMRKGLEHAGLNPDCVQLLETTDRAAVGELLRLEGLIDLAIPRGGESLIRAVVQQAHIPVIKHYTGNCHIYVDSPCDHEMATRICLNAKTQRPGVCNSVETILFHADALPSGLLEAVGRQLMDQGVCIRGDERTCTALAGATAATVGDWSTEYLDLIVAMAIVDDLDQAIDHINRYGSKHTDAIITGHVEHADRFVAGVDSANVFVNCSTRFSDGGQYGLGAEIGISTDKLHARGPMGAADLTTYKWVVRGEGQVRE